MALNLINLFAVLLAAWVAGSFASRLGYPSILGELAQRPGGDAAPGRGEGGREVLRYARAHGIQTPVVIITGYGDEETAEECLAAGAFDFVSKPVDRLSLLGVPFLWGPVHGQWVGAIFLPIWLFADSILASAADGGVTAIVGAVVVGMSTLLFEWWFAKRANGLAFRRVINRQTAEQFARRQRLWAIAAVPVAVALFGWALWFRLAAAPALGIG